MIKPLKQTFLRNLAATIIGRKIPEKLLCNLCSQEFARKHLKVGAIAFACMSVLEKPEARVTDMGDYKLWVNLSEHSGICLYFFRTHNEPFSAWLVSELVNSGDVCIDVGANIGSYTFLLASKVGHQGKVIAFEPQPNLYKMLLDSISLNQFNDFVFADRRAVYSKSDETLKFYISENLNNSGTSSLVNHGVFVSQDNFITVKTVTLADYFKETHLERCNLLKIDVERSELEVIQGMMELLKHQRIDYILLEQLADSEAQMLLEAMGYTGWLVDESARVLVGSKVVDRGCFGNYLFISPGKVNEFKQRYGSILNDTM